MIYCARQAMMSTFQAKKLDNITQAIVRLGEPGQLNRKHQSSLTSASRFLERAGFRSSCRRLLRVADCGPHAFTSERRELLPAAVARWAWHTCPPRKIRRPHDPDSPATSEHCDSFSGSRTNHGRASDVLITNDWLAVEVHHIPMFAITSVPAATDTVAVSEQH